MTAFMKRIEPTASGFDCYLNTSKVGTRATEQEARNYLNELAYDAERGAPLPFEPSTTTDEYDRIIRICHVIEQHVPADYFTKCDPKPISTLADGSTVYGRFDSHNGEPCCVYTDTHAGWYVSADSDGTAGIWHAATGIDIDAVTIEKLALLKAFVNSGVVEHLLACGLAWETDQPVPAAQPAHDHKRGEMLALIDSYFAKR